MKKNYIIVMVLVAIQLWQFIAVPLLPMAWAWTLLPLALLNNSMWSIMHEAIHGNLFKGRMNLWAGRVLSCLFGSSFQFLSAGHLSHHALNRSEAEQLEIIPEGMPKWKARLVYYFFMCGGLYVAEVLVPLAFIGPMKSLKKKLPEKTMIRMVFERATRKHLATALESIAAVTFLTCSALLYGANWPLFVGILFARAFLISSLEYIYHYGNVLGDVNAGYNLYLPRWVSACLFHFNYHHVHHEAPKVPWYELPKEAGRRNAKFDSGYFQAALRAWKGPMTSEEAKIWREKHT